MWSQLKNHHQNKITKISPDLNETKTKPKKLKYPLPVKLKTMETTNPEENKWHPKKSQNEWNQKFIQHHLKTISFEQAKQFSDVTKVTSMMVTKLDGTAKGGVVIGISDQLNIPIKYIGTGESIDDIQLFNKTDFVESFFQKNI